MAILLVNGVAVKDPSSMTWGEMDISSQESGRTLNAKMHKTIVAKKVKLDLGWSNPTQAEAAAILQTFDSTYVDITYPDVKTGSNQTKTFYTGDKTAPFKMWTVGSKIYSTLSFNCIEQ